MRNSKRYKTKMSEAILSLPTSTIPTRQDEMVSKELKSLGDRYRNFKKIIRDCRFGEIALTEIKRDMDSVFIDVMGRHHKPGNIKKKFISIG